MNACTQSTLDEIQPQPDTDVLPFTTVFGHENLSSIAARVAILLSDSFSIDLESHFMSICADSSACGDSSAYIDSSVDSRVNP